MFKKLRIFLTPKAKVEDIYNYFIEKILLVVALAFIVFMYLVQLVNIIFFTKPNLNYSYLANPYFLFAMVGIFGAHLNIYIIKKVNPKFSAYFIGIFLVLSAFILESMDGFYYSSQIIGLIFMCVLFISIFFSLNYIFFTNFVIIVIYTIIGSTQTSLYIDKTYGSLYSTVSMISCIVFFITGLMFILRKQIENQIKSDESVISSINHLLNTVIENSPVAVVVTQDDKIVIWNNTAYKLFGWSFNDIMNDPMKYIPQNKIDEYNNVKKGTFKDELVILETERETKDKMIIEVYLSIAPLKNSLNNTIGTIEVLMDITEKKELDKRRDSFISMVSHELKTPITTLKIYNDLLMKKVDDINDIKSNSLIKKMSNQVAKIITLIDKLSDSSKVQLGKVKLDLKKVYIDELIINTTLQLQEIYKKNQFIIEENVKVEIVIDEIRIGQVLINLITNALKYSPNDSIIIINSKLEDDKLIISIKDFGIGIDKNYQTKIFERFYQVIKKSDTLYPGLGIGLFISKEIISLHKGQIWVESELGRGSTFFISLPTK